MFILYFRIINFLGDMTGIKQVNGDIWIKCQFYKQCQTTSWIVTKLDNVPRTELVAREDSIETNPKEYNVTLAKRKHLTVYVLTIKKAFVKYEDREYICNCYFEHIVKNIRDITFTQTSSGGTYLINYTLLLKIMVTHIVIYL